MAVNTLLRQSIWITGAHGFIGRNLSLLLTRLGYKVFGLGHGSWSVLEASEFGVSKWIDGSLIAENLDLLLNLSDIPDKIFHLAGGSSVGLSLEKPNEDYYRTVVGTENLLGWVKLNAPSCKLVAISSAAVYGDCYKHPISERAVCEPCSPYGQHKLIMERLCQSYAKTFGLNIVIARLFSVYGKYLQKQLLWDLCSKLLLDNVPITLGGSGNETRDWTDIRDIVLALVALSDLASNDAPIINVGTGQGVSVRDVAELVLSSWPSNAEIFFNKKTRIGDPHNLVGDCRLLNSLGVTPKFPVQIGVPNYVEWYLKHMKIR